VLGRIGQDGRVQEPPDVHLVRGVERVREVELLADLTGGRVGLDGVLADLNRTARVSRVPGLAVEWGFRWQPDDESTRRWWPQGITTSADAGPEETYAGRRVLMTSAYSKDMDGERRGSRISVVDLTDPRDIRYRHVLLVEPYVDDGRVGVRPVNVHAGGIVWHGEHLHVAGTRRGFCTFRLDDVMRVPSDSGLAVFGYRYVLPLRFGYDAVTADGREQLRYSFLSLDRSTSPHELVAGEYGRDEMTTRLARYEIDPTTGLLRDEEDGAARPLLVDERGIGHMQGAVVVRGRWYLTTSAGRYLLGSVWSGTPGDLRRHRFAVPVGPEDLTYWPSTDMLWSLTEYPGHRYVFAMRRDRFG
jgi:hypothetical protein